MTAGAPALVGRLQKRRARRRDMAARRAALVDDRPQRRDHAGLICRRGQRLADLVGQGVAIGLFLEELRPLRSLLRRQRRHIDEDRRPVVLAGADRERGARPRLDREAHHRFIDAADLLDVECAVGQPFAIEAEQQVENAEDAAVRHGRGRRLIRWTVLPLQKWKRFRIEQFAAAPADPAAADRHDAPAGRAPAGGTRRHGARPSYRDDARHHQAGAYRASGRHSLGHKAPAPRRRCATG